MINWFKNLPLWFQIAIIIVIVIILYSIYRYLKKKAEASNYNAAVSQSQTALTQLANKGIHPSYAQAEYTSMANDLQQAFTGCGAAYQTIVAPIFQKMKNDADIYALIANYGVRDIPECGWGTFNGDLSATIGHKFSGLLFCSHPLPGQDSCGSVKEINKILSDKSDPSLTFQF